MKSQPHPLAWSLERSLVHLIHRASQVAEDQFSRRVGVADITPRQLAVLAAVAHNPNINQTEIVRLTGIDRSTLADIVRRLVGNGLLQRSRTREDARAYAIHLTPKGTALAEQMSERAVAAEVALLEPLSPADREHLVNLLQSVVDGAAKGERPVAAKGGAVRPTGVMPA